MREREREREKRSSLEVEQQQQQRVQRKKKETEKRKVKKRKKCAPTAPSPFLPFSLPSHPAKALKGEIKDDGCRGLDFHSVTQTHLAATTPRASPSTCPSPSPPLSCFVEIASKNIIMTSCLGASICGGLRAGEEEEEEEEEECLITDGKGKMKT